MLVAHSPDDEIIPFRHAEMLFEAASEPKVLLQLAGGHNDGFIFMREAWVDVLADFLIRNSVSE